MKHIFAFLILCHTFVCASSQNVKGLNINQSFFPFEMIDSITYTNQSDNFFKNIWFYNNLYSFRLTDDIFVQAVNMPESNGWYEIEDIDTADYNRALMSTDGIAFLSFENEYGGEDYCIYKIGDIENKIIIEFDSVNRLKEIISRDYLTLVESTDNGHYSMTTFDSDKTFVEHEFEQNIKKSKASSNSSFDNNLSNIINILDYIQNGRTGESSIWDRIGDLGSFLLNNQLSKIGGGLYGKLVDLSLDELRRTRKKYHEMMLNILYGNCSIEITQITNDEYNYHVSLNVSGTESLPKNRYNNNRLGIYYGLVGIIDNEPSVQYNDIFQGYFFTTDDTQKNIDLGQLEINSHYYLRPYIISYNQVRYNHVSNDNIRYGNCKDFTTPKPNGAIIEVVENSITENSATIKCSFSHIGKGVTCGVEIDSEDFEVKLVNANNSNGEQTIQLTGLEPGTQYKCYAYVKYNGQMYSSRECVSFATKVPSIVGTWNVVETYSSRPFPGAEWETKTREYSLSLNENGSIQILGSDTEYISGSWSYTSSGSFNATGHIIATQTQNTWDRFNGTVDDVKNPQKITGTRYRGNMNQVTYVEDAAGSFVMTR